MAGGGPLAVGVALSFFLLHAVTAKTTRSITEQGNNRCTGVSAFLYIMFMCVHIQVPWGKADTGKIAGALYQRYAVDGTMRVKISLLGLLNGKIA
jgi:hypothetical protein